MKESFKVRHNRLLLLLGKAHLPDDVVERLHKNGNVAIYTDDGIYPFVDELVKKYYSNFKIISSVREIMPACNLEDSKISFIANVKRGNLFRKPETLELMRQVYKLANSGKSFDQIAKQLNLDVSGIQFLHQRAERKFK